MWPWQGTFWGECFEGAYELAGDDGCVGSCEQHADAGFEGCHFAGAASCAFGEENVDAAIFLQPIAHVRQGMSAAVVSPHRQRIEYGRSEQRFGRRVEKGVACSDGKNAASVFSWNRHGHGGGVEMAAVIGSENERRLAGQVFFSLDAKSMHHSHARARHPPRCPLHQSPNQARFTVQASHAFGRWKPKISGRLVLPVIHSNYPVMMRVG